MLKADKIIYRRGFSHALAICFIAFMGFVMSFLMGMIFYLAAGLLGALVIGFVGMAVSTAYFFSRVFTYYSEFVKID